jgi:hypothetical protein
MPPMFKYLSVAFLIPFALFSGCRTAPTSVKSEFSHFVGLDDFSSFTRTQNERGETVLLSPKINSEIPWNELIVSWNAGAPAGTFLKVETRAISADHITKFYQLANWSPDNKIFPRSSFRSQKDADGSVRTDTLVLTHPADAVQIRLTLGGTNSAGGGHTRAGSAPSPSLRPSGETAGVRGSRLISEGGSIQIPNETDSQSCPTLKFLGCSLSNTKVPTAPIASNHAAWGKVVPTPERSQHGYAGGNGWCSPTSLSMALARWSEILNRPEMNLTVPQAAANVYDANYDGTGNWAFNTAFAGSFAGMRSFVTRFDDLAEVEDWIAAGVPVILSARWDWLRPGRPMDSAGHLIVCIGFTENGDVIVNDPAAHLDRGQTVRQIYKREDVLRAWSSSHHTVYLVYPTTAKLPENRFGHW